MDKPGVSGTIHQINPAQTTSLDRLSACLCIRRVVEYCTEPGSVPNLESPSMVYERRGLMTLKPAYDGAGPTSRASRSPEPKRKKASPEVPCSLNETHRYPLRNALALPCRGGRMRSRRKGLEREDEGGKEMPLRSSSSKDKFEHRDLASLRP